ncbi:MAG: hypothetical protein MJ132_02935 [Clostridia bacterium]|nr:hypothetical protein [Clostridia bacterium]
MIFSFASCNKAKKKTPAVSKYEGTYLLNGFETVEDLYKVRQLTLRTGENAYSGYSAKGKLDIVTVEDFLSDDANRRNYNEADLAPKQGKGALHIDYVSHQASKGGFTKITAMFKNCNLNDLPTEKIGQLSVWVFNDNATEQKLTLGLVDSATNIIEYGADPFVLTPYSWTECRLDLAPTITKYQAKKIAGVGLEFDDKQAKSFYLDDLTVSFVQKTTEEEQEYLKKVQQVENDIKAFLAENSVSMEVGNALEGVFAEYVELPEAYQALVSNYPDLKTFIDQYLKTVSDSQMMVDGTAALVYYDRILGLSQIERCIGAKATYTTAEHAPGEAGSTCFTFDGTMDWIELLDVPVAESYDEVRVWVKNDSKDARAMLMFWTSLIKTGGKVYDVNGNEVTNSFVDGVDRNNNVIGTDQWVQIVFNQAVAVTNINLCSVEKATGNTTLSTGKLYIGKIVGVSKGASMLDKIDALMKKSSYSAQDYRDVYDLYTEMSAMSPDQLAVLGDERVSFINDFYKKNKTRIISEKINGVKLSSEYTASQIHEILDLQEIYNGLSSAEKSKVNAAYLNKLIKSISGYDKNGTLMDVTEYSADYADELVYSTKDKASGSASLKVSRTFTDKSSVTYNFPQPITGAKKVRITLKNASSKPVAFFLDGSGPQGAKWMEPSNTGYMLNPEDGYKELVYDADGYSFTGMIFTLGPWDNGDMNVYIDSIDVVYDSTDDLVKQVQKLSSIANQDEFSTMQVKKILELYGEYQKLSSAQKKKVDSALLNKLYGKIAKHNQYTTTMDAALYAEEVQNDVFHSNKVKYGSNPFSLKLTKKVENKAEAVFALPKTVTGKELKVTVKNASNAPVAFFMKARRNGKDEWLVPVGRDYMLEKNSPWITLTYNIAGYSVTNFIATIGPWENGNLSLYIGNVEAITSNIGIVKNDLKTIGQWKDKTEFKPSEIKLILKTNSTYQTLTAKEKASVDVTVLNALLNKIKYYNSSDYLNVTKFEEKYDNCLKYSVKDINKPSNYSMKYTEATQGGETYLQLPKKISGAAQVKVTLKNVSKGKLAFWVKQTEAQGNKWLEPINHGYFVDNNEGYVTLTYDIFGKEVDAFVFTVGPWQAGEVEAYISDVQIVSVLEQVKQAVKDCDKILAAKVLNANDVNSIVSALTLYEEKLTPAEQKSVDVSKLMDVLKKVDKIATTADFADITRYKFEYADNLLYSFEDSALNGNDMSLVIKATTTASEKEILFPEDAQNNYKYLNVTLKNTADKDVAFWIKAVKDGKETWLTPINHGANPVISGKEGFVELQYNVENCQLTAFECTYGPWQAGDFSVCISDIKMFNSYLDIVKAELKKCEQALKNKVLTEDDIATLKNAVDLYNTMLTAAEKKQLDVSEISALLTNIEVFGAKSSNLSLGAYPSSAAQNIFYSYEDAALTEGCDVAFYVKSAEKEFSLDLANAYKDLVSLKITVKNPNDEALNFYLEDTQGNRIAPTNHENSAVLQKDEGYVTLEYNVEKVTVSKFVFTNENGNIGAYINNIEGADSKYEPLKVTSFTGGTFTDNGGSCTLKCNGITNWSDVNFDTVSYTKEQELHLFVKSDSELNRAVYLNWTAPLKVYDENGELYNGVATYVIPGDNKVYELVFTSPLSFNQINMTSMDAKNSPTTSVGTFTVLGYTLNEIGNDYTALSVSKMTGGTFTTDKSTATFTFNETVGWCDIDFSQITFANELHVFVKNNSKYRRMFDLDWKSPDKVFDQNGQDVTASISNILPANDDSVYEFVYYGTKSPCRQFNCTSLNDKNASIASQGSLTILGYTVK